MTTNKIIFIFALLFLSATLGGGELLAQTNAPLTEYKLLEPLPGITSDSAGTKTNANIYIAGLFNLTLALAVVFAVLRLIYAGITYMTSDAFGTKGAAKKIIEQTLWGLALAISAWVIVAAVIKPQEPGAFVFDLSLDAIPLPKDNNPPISPTGGGTLTQQQVMTQLNAIGIKTDGPLNVAGLQQVTINELARLKSQCNSCTIVITSATTGNHAPGTYSHATGYKVDLRSVREGAALTNYITQNYTKLPDRKDGAKMYQAPSRALYALESDHWDVQVIK